MKARRIWNAAMAGAVAGLLGFGVVTCSLGQAHAQVIELPKTDTPNIDYLIVLNTAEVFCEIEIPKHDMRGIVLGAMRETKITTPELMESFVMIASASLASQLVQAGEFERFCAGMRLKLVYS